jgi:hypothetical protein
VLFRLFPGRSRLRTSQEQRIAHLRQGIDAVPGRDETITAEENLPSGLLACRSHTAHEADRPT